MPKITITVEANISDEEAEMFHDVSTLTEQAEIVRDILRSPHYTHRYNWRLQNVLQRFGKNQRHNQDKKMHIWKAIRSWV